MYHVGISFHSMVWRCRHYDKRIFHQSMQVPRRHLISFVYSALSCDVSLLLLAHQEPILYSWRNMADGNPRDDSQYHFGIRLPETL